jgi:urocanate hydratase
MRLAKRALTNDAMMDIFRHADAGYEIAQQCADSGGLGVKIPME